jgi:hypothetical protein
VNDNLENHMVINAPDAPWNAPDATGTCDVCHEKADTDNVVVNGIEQSLCESCDEKQARVREEKFWAEQLAAARPGDVVVAFYKTYRVVLTVGRQYTYGDAREVWGWTMQFDEKGRAYAFTENGTISYARFSAELESLQVVAP